MARARPVVSDLAGRRAGADGGPDACHAHGQRFSRFPVFRCRPHRVLGRYVGGGHPSAGQGQGCGRAQHGRRLEGRTAVRAQVHPVRSAGAGAGGGSVSGGGPGLLHLQDSVHRADPAVFCPSGNGHHRIRVLHCPVLGGRTLAGSGHLGWPQPQKRGVAGRVGGAHAPGAAGADAAGTVRGGGHHCAGAVHRLHAGLCLYDGLGQRHHRPDHAGRFWWRRLWADGIQWPPGGGNAVHRHSVCSADGVDHAGHDHGHEHHLPDGDRWPG